MATNKQVFDGLANGTYGIEVEFGTHDNQLLSFTHLEVVHLIPPVGLEEHGWKIETDADYTLELVSPTFSTKGTGGLPSIAGWLR